jgi:hypothetical protein
MAITSHSGFFIQDIGGASGHALQFGNFELVVPNYVHQGLSDTRGFTHYWRDNVADGKWYKGARFGYEFAEGVGWPSLIQFEDPLDPPSDTSMDGGLLAIARGSQTGALGAWQINPGGSIPNWTFVALSDGQGHAIVDTDGSPALIQSDYGNHHNIELVVPNRTAGLTHYWGDWTKDRGVLHRTGDFAQGIGRVSSAALIQSGFTDAQGNRNLEVLAVANQGANGRSQLYQCWRLGTGAWSDPLPVVVTSSSQGGDRYITGVHGTPALIQRNNDSHNFELLISDANQTVTHYWRDNSNSSMLWRFGWDLGNYGGYQEGAQGLIQSNYGDPGHLEVLRLNVPPFSSGSPAESWDFRWLDWDGWKGPSTVVPEGGF